MDLKQIQQKIHEVRGIKVILDFDIAKLYEVETRVLNQAIKRNKARFPEDFMFRLSPAEWQTLSSSQFVMMELLPKNRTGKYLPFAFTEHGITMLASVLKSEKAILMNLAIVRAFISLRQFAVKYTEVLAQLTDLQQRLGEHDVQLSAIYDALENMLDKKAVEKEWLENRPRIGFKP